MWIPAQVTSLQRIWCYHQNWASPLRRNTAAFIRISILTRWMIIVVQKSRVDFDYFQLRASDDCVQTDSSTLSRTASDCPEYGEEESNATLSLYIIIRRRRWRKKSPKLHFSSVGLFYNRSNNKVYLIIIYDSIIACFYTNMFVRGIFSALSTEWR